MTWVHTVNRAMGWFWAYVLGYIFAASIVFTFLWAAITFVGWLLFGTDPISGNPGIGG